jgi:6,7-dimethyl-8-ribityllumazine synthase
MTDVTTIEGDFGGNGRKFAIVAGRFNGYRHSLVAGAIDVLVRHGVNAKDITLIKVPGCFELPLAVKRVAESKGGYHAIIALGAVIRGATPHFDYVAGQCAAGLARIARRVHRLTAILKAGLERVGFAVPTTAFFDTLTAATGEATAGIHARAEAQGVNLRHADARTIGLSLDERPPAPASSRVAHRGRCPFTVAISMPPRATRCRPRSRAPRRSSRIRRSTATTARPRCCATCAVSRIATSRSTGR